MSADQKTDVNPSPEPGIFYKVTSPTGTISYLLGTVHGRFKTPLELVQLIESKEITSVAIEWPEPTGNYGPHIQKLLFDHVPIFDHAIYQTATKLPHIKPHILDDQEDMSKFTMAHEILHTTTEKFSSTQEIVQIFNSDPGYYKSILTLSNVSSYSAKDPNPLYHLYQTQQVAKIQKFGEEHPGAIKHYKAYERNAKWLPHIRSLLDAGQACVIAGLYHMITSHGKGLIDDLSKLGYQFEPMSITIETAKPLTAAEIEKISLQAVEADLSIAHLNEFNLSELIKAYHNKTLSPLQKNQLHQFLFCSYPNLLAHQDPALIDAIGSSQYSMWHLYTTQKDKMLPAIFPSSRNPEELIVQLFSVKDPAPQTKAKQIGYAIWVCCFYPELAKQLLARFSKENPNALLLFNACGGQAFAENTSTKTEEAKREEKTELKSAEQETKLGPQSESTSFELSDYEKIFEICGCHRLKSFFAPLLKQADQNHCCFLEEIDEKLYAEVHKKFDPTDIQRYYQILIKSDYSNKLHADKFSPEKIDRFKLVLRSILLELAHHFNHDKEFNNDYYSKLAVVGVFQSLARKKSEAYLLMLQTMFPLFTIDQLRQFDKNKGLINQPAFAKLTEIYDFGKGIPLPTTPFKALKDRVNKFVGYTHSLPTETELSPNIVSDIKKISKDLQSKLGEVLVDESTLSESKTIPISPLFYSVLQKELMDKVCNKSDKEKLAITKYTQNRYLLWEEETESLEPHEESESLKQHNEIQTLAEQLFIPSSSK